MNFNDKTHRPKILKRSGCTNLILLGLSGAGKSSIGKRFAQYIGFGFLDTDACVEKIRNKSVAKIFQKDGEDSFRKTEKEVIQGLKGIRNHVISLGGGAVLDDDNWSWIQELGCPVWLDCPPREVARRLLARKEELLQRPLYSDLKDTPPKDLLQEVTKRLDTILLQRKSRYEEAQVIVSLGMASIEVEAQRLRQALEEDEFNE